jgi:hypothetical protein
MVCWVCLTSVQEEHNGTLKISAWMGMDKLGQCFGTRICMKLQSMCNCQSQNKSSIAGVRVILCILERGHSSIQPQVLSFISDMIRMNPAACDQIRSWQSQCTDRTALQVLLHIWRDAESDWGVCTNGVLNSVSKPLAGIGRRNLWIPKHEVRLGPQLTKTNLRS